MINLNRSFFYEGGIKLAEQQDKNKLPPKSCTIERLVTVSEDVQKVIAGEKTATRRNGIYADINEIMSLESHEFIVDNIYSQALGDMTDGDAKQEGYQNLEAYKEAILAIHPGMRWVPKLKVWVHEYKPVES